MARKKRGALATLFSSVATTISGWFGSSGYNATDPRRKLIERQIMANRRTANELANGALAPLRSHCRHLQRNNPTAISISRAHQALIVGTGISLEPIIKTGMRQTAALKAAQQAISDEWDKWQAHCGVNGESLTQLQNLGILELDGAGEVLWRWVILPDLIEQGEIPLRIMPLEGEWIVDDAVTSQGDLTAVNGILVDRYGRPRQFVLLNPNQEVDNKPEVVPVEDLNHIFETDRPLQNRGIPGLSAAIEMLKNAQDLVDIELYAAKQTASPALVVTSDLIPDDVTDTDTYGDADDPVHGLKMGSVARLLPGESLSAYSHTRPTPEVAQFDLFLRGKIAASQRISSGFLDRDYTRANYSSRKAEQIDNNMILGPVRDWYGECTAGRAFMKVLPFLAVHAGVSAQGIGYRLIPDEIPFLDPVKDTMGILLGIAGGLTNFQTEIGKRGGNAKDIHEQLKKELTDDPLLAEILGSNLKSMLGAGSVQDLANGKVPEPVDMASEDDEENDSDEGGEDARYLKDADGNLYARTRNGLRKL